MKKQGGSNYDCRFIMQLDKKLALETLKEAIEQSSSFKLLERTRLVFPRFKIPEWQIANTSIPSPISEYTSDSNEIPSEVFAKPIELKNDFLSLTKNTTSL